MGTINLSPADTFRFSVENSLGVGHEDLLWRIRLEPGLIDVFTKIWGTDELLVSFGEDKIQKAFTAI